MKLSTKEKKTAKHLFKYNSGVVFVLSLITLSVLFVLSAMLLSYFHNILIIQIIVLLCDFLIIIATNLVFYSIYPRYASRAVVESAGDGLTTNLELSAVLEDRRKLNGYLSIVEHIEQDESFKNIMRFIYNTFRPFIPYNYMGVGMLDREFKSIRISHVISDDYPSCLNLQLLLKNTLVGGAGIFDIIISGQPIVLNNIGNESDRLSETENAVRSVIIYPLLKNGNAIGTLIIGSNKRGAYRKEHQDFLKMISHGVMLAFDKDVLINDMVLSSTLALATLAEERDNETGDHLVRMSKYSSLLAELCASDRRYKGVVDMDYIAAIERFSPLHDIGKVAIRDAILLKPGRLTPEEFKVMKTHTTYGARVLRLADQNVRMYSHGIFEMGIEITESHHERWDGSGYPNNLKGSEIPLCARIVAIADVLDALTTKRPYKEPFSFEVSVGIIEREAGTHFDPDIIEIFTKNINAFRNEHDLFFK